MKIKGRAPGIDKTELNEEETREFLKFIEGKMSDIDNLIVDFENVEESSEKYRRDVAADYLNNPIMTDKDLAGSFENIPLTFTSYQKMTQLTRNYPDTFPPDVYLALGLAGEVGECTEHIKKIHRNDNGILSAERKEKLKKEFGDALFYLAALAFEVGINLEEIANINQLKLLKRLKEKTIKSEGDNR